MRIHRFYLNGPISGKTFDVSDKDLIHQWKSVFRYNVGSQVIVFNGDGNDYLCMITSLRAMGASLEVYKQTKKPILAGGKNVWLCAALIKKDNFELVVEKAVELGVSNIVPILCEHSEKKKINEKRVEKISIEASEQSGRGDIIKIHKTMTLQELFASGVLPQEKFALDPSGKSWSEYEKLSLQPSVAVFVGPEGGFSPKEIEFFRTYNVNIVSLGSQILRAETACIAILSLLLL